MGTRDRGNQEATVFVGDLDEQVDEALLWELMLQCAPVASVYIPKDRVTGEHQGYGFVEFASADDVEYAIKIMNMVNVFGRSIRVNKSQQSSSAKDMDIGANLFVGNLDDEVDEKYLHDAFSRFGFVVAAKVMRDQDTGSSRGFGFVNYDNFEASDAAIAALDGQYLANKPINVMYALKKGSSTERHGTDAERLLAARRQALIQSQRPARPAIQPVVAPVAPPPSMAPNAMGPPGAPAARPPMMPGMPQPPGMPGGPPPGMIPPAQQQQMMQQRMMQQKMQQQQMQQMQHMQQMQRMQQMQMQGMRPPMMPGFPGGPPRPGMPGMPPQGMPPQGMPPGMGRPPQGMQPQGMPPQGMPPQGMRPQGMPPQGQPPQGGLQGAPQQQGRPQGAPPQQGGPAQQPPSAGRGGPPTAPGAPPGAPGGQPARPPMQGVPQLSGNGPPGGGRGRGVVLPAYVQQQQQQQQQK
mmetsp:Transcript_21168/g.82152  ORF Transcript_21168/g.82152 Transcript_21168/m.82152 type:complete len:465 (+) Transcript_21168:44-1438(+)